MGPMPWGDSVVDAADLEVLMSYWGQEFDDPHFIAHWKLDETEGDVAHDSVGQNDAVVWGNAIWQPEGGQINGALEFDGVDDYVDAQPEFNPAHGVFSIFAWIKGGGPGQVILSNGNRANWLMTDANQDRLSTELFTGGQTFPFNTEVQVADGNWHRVGVVWDGMTRYLYVDGLEVMHKTGLSFSEMQEGLYIGAGSGLEPGTFWSGMIDDVRIYDRVVVP